MTISLERRTSGDFAEKLGRAVRQNRSLLCIGLDPDPGLMPDLDIASFNRAIVEATADLVCAYKPNLAFYEALGRPGYEALVQTISAIPEHIPIIGDAKRGDVGHTARAYARALFEVHGFDAVTVNPYLGMDSLEPFLDYGGRGVFVLCKTSNTGSGDFQALPVGPDNIPLYQVVAQCVQQQAGNASVGLVVGATFPEELRRVREICPDMPLLIPGIGAQGGDLAWAVRGGLNGRGEGAIISASRQILYASRGADFAARARDEASRLRDQINGHLEAALAGH